MRLYVLTDTKTDEARPLSLMDLAHTTNPDAGHSLLIQEEELDRIADLPPGQCRVVVSNTRYVITRTNTDY